jgi:biotin transporter BioY
VPTKTAAHAVVRSRLLRTRLPSRLIGANNPPCAKRGARNANSVSVQPSFGYIIGFWVSSVIISATIQKNIIRYNSEKNKKLPFIAKAVSYMLLSILVLYVFGVAYMYFIFNFYLSDPKTLYTLIFGTTWIFFIGDIIKFSVALPLCLAIQRRLPKPV